MTRVKVVTFYKKTTDSYNTEVYFLEEATYSEIPSIGSFVQHKIRQHYLGYKVEAVFHLQPNSENWDIALLVGNANTSIKSSDFEKQLYRAINYRSYEENRKNKDRENVKNPSEAWQRRKDLYSRIQAGETADSIAIELGIKPARVKGLATEWRNLLTRVYLDDQEKNNEQS